MTDGLPAAPRRRRYSAHPRRPHRLLRPAVGGQRARGGARARSRRSRRAPRPRGRSRASHVPGPGAAHPRRGGRASEEAIATRVGQAAARMPKGQWLGGRGWDQNRWPGMRMPTPRLPRPRRAGSPGGAGPDRRPRHLGQLGRAGRVRHHARDARSHRRHRRPRCSRRAHRAPGGHGAASRPARCIRRPTTRASTRRFATPSGNAWPRVSPGSMRWAWISATLAAYRRLVERGHFPFRNYAAVAGRDEAAWDHYRDRGPEVMGDGRVVVGALKLLADGALGSRGAALHHPYCDDPENTGLVLIPPDELYRAHRGRGGAGLPGLRPRHRRPRQHPRPRHLRARAGRASRRAGPPAADRACPDPRRGRYRALRAAGGHAEHAGHALHLRHALGGGAAGCGPPARRLCLALAPRHRSAHRGRLRLSRRGPESLPRHLRRGDPAAARAERIAAGNPASA